MIAAQRFHSGAVGVDGEEFAVAFKEDAAVVQNVLRDVPAWSKGEALGSTTLAVGDLDVRSRRVRTRIDDATVREIQRVGAIGLALDRLARYTAGRGYLPNLPGRVGGGFSRKEDSHPIEGYGGVRGRIKR